MAAESIVNARQWSARMRLLISCLAPLTVIGVVAWRWSSVSAGLAAMSDADREWLIVAGTAATLTWAASSCCQMGATLAPLPVKRVFAVQVAGSFVNHIVPAGLGIAGLNVRMLMRCGLSKEKATGAVSLNVVAGVVLHIVVLAGLLAAHSSAGYGGYSLLPVVLSVAGLAAGLTLAGWIVARRSDRWKLRLVELLRDSRDVLCHPRRSLLLWSGSAAVPALHVLTLAAVLHSLGQPAPLLIVALAYLSASAAAAFVPSPGGFGSLDVALLTALTASGLTTQAALTTVIGYRLVTVWIPLLPGAGSLLLLMHRRLV